ncbi:MAG: hypothetical protein SPI30_01335 [Prevotella sp.]|nr:hypothetical protein [Prevotella sp.]
MKVRLNKFLLGAALLAVGILSSCNTDNEGRLYTPTNSNVTLENAAPATIQSYETSKDIVVRVFRSTTAGEQTVAYSFTPDTDGIFTDTNGGQATFADGSGVALITIKAENMERGSTYGFTITLDEALKSTIDTVTNHANYTTTVSVFCDYNWVSVDGKGSLVSAAFGETWEVDLMKAEGYNVYKVLSMYAENVDVIFEIADDNSVTVASQYAWDSSDYGKVYVVGDVNGDQSGVAGTYSADSKTVTLSLNHYVPGVGSFGTFVDVLTLP